MNETTPFYPESSGRPTARFHGRKEIDVEKVDDVAGRPLLKEETFRLRKAQEEKALRERRRISAATDAAVKNIERRERLARTAAEITREQTAFTSRKQSVEVLIKRLSDLTDRKKKLSFFDFAGRKVFNELISQAETDLQKARGARKDEAQEIIIETMRPLAPIRELPDMAVEDLSDTEVELESKRLELSSLSLLNIFNWSRRSRLQEEIRMLKKKIIGEKIAKALEKE